MMLQTDNSSALEFWVLMNQEITSEQQRGVDKVTASFFYVTLNHICRFSHFLMGVTPEVKMKTHH